MAVVRISTSLPQVELGAGAAITVDTGDPAAILTKLVVYGVYFAPGDPFGVPLSGVFLPQELSV